MISHFCSHKVQCIDNLTMSFPISTSVPAKINKFHGFSVTFFYFLFIFALLNGAPFIVITGKALLEETWQAQQTALWWEMNWKQQTMTRTKELVSPQQSKWFNVQLLRVHSLDLFLSPAWQGICMSGASATALFPVLHQEARTLCFLWNVTEKTGI